MAKFLRASFQNSMHNIFMSNDRKSRKRSLFKFAESVGLEYFGNVSRHYDSQQIIKGFTTSLSHRDNHYCTGPVDGYNISIVDRCDAIWQPDATSTMLNWLIMTFELHTKQNIPHFFINTNNHEQKSYTKFFTIFHTMKPVSLGTFESYSDEFTSRFILYSQPSASIQIERLFPADITRVLGAHFWPLSAEQHEGILYIYSDEQRISQNLLDTMLENGLWLAAHLDRQAELI